MLFLNGILYAIFDHLYRSEDSSHDTLGNILNVNFDVMDDNVLNILDI